MITTGYVSQVTPGSYNVVIACADGNDRICNLGARAISGLGGVMDAELPAVRTDVIVYTTNQTTCHLLNYMAPQSTARTPLNVNHETVEDGHTGIHGEEAHANNFSSAGPETFMDNQGGRPVDVLPGDWAKITEDGTLLALMPYLARIASGEASVSVSGLEGLLEQTSKWFRHFHALGATQMFNDNGLCSLEFTGTPFRHETLGKTSATVIGAPTVTDPTEDEGYIKPTGDDHRALSRFQLYLGSLGNLVSAFMAAAPEDTETTGDAEGKGRATMHLNIDPHGQMQLYSTAGIRIGKRGIIPLPTRIRSPHDPEGDSPEETDPADRFDQDDKLMSDPALRHLGLSDKDDYETAQAYRQFDEQPKDFHTPEEEKAAKLDKFIDRMGFMDFGDDGSIILRDAWGSEIRMIGGNIILAPAKNIIHQPHESSITIAGKDIIQTAEKDIDITSNTENVRIKAEKAAQLHGHGILLNSSAETIHHGFPKGTEKLEQAPIAGIVMHAPKAAVTVLAEHRAERTETSVTHRVTDRSYIDKSVVFINDSIQWVGSDSVMSLSAGSLSVVARNLSLVSGGGITLVQNGFQSPVIEWADGEDDIFSDFNDQTELVTLREEMTTVNEEHLESLDVLQRVNLGFRYRTSTTLGTTASLFAGSDIIGLPETWLQHLLGAGVSVPGISSSTSKMKLNSVNGTYPWPGATQHKADFLVKLNSTVNTISGNTPRADQKATPGSTSATSFDDYTIS